MTSGGFEPTIPAIKRLQTYALARKPIEIGYGYLLVTSIMKSCY
jgi:hypothetical protein